jgi:hypothetical protein
VLACKVKARDGEVESEAEADTCAESGRYRARVRPWAAPGDAMDVDEEAEDESMSSSILSASNGPC